MSKKDDKIVTATNNDTNKKDDITTAKKIEIEDFLLCVCIGIQGKDKFRGMMKQIMYDQYNSDERTIQYITDISEKLINNKNVIEVAKRAVEKITIPF